MVRQLVINAVYKHYTGNLYKFLNIYNYNNSHNLVLFKPFNNKYDNIYNLIALHKETKEYYLINTLTKSINNLGYLDIIDYTSCVEKHGLYYLLPYWSFVGKTKDGKYKFTEQHYIN